jgi:TPR repeat protein
MEVLFLIILLWIVSAFIFLPRFIGGRGILSYDDYLRNRKHYLGNLGEAAAKYDSAAELINAAKQGEAAAQYELGYMYYAGYCVRRNRHEALNWYKKAAEQGYAAAQYRLGEMYSDGDSDANVPKDEFKAVEWLQKAADQKGQAKAQKRLAGMYADGRGVPQDKHKAEKWYRKALDQDREAAAQGDVEGLYNLGMRYAFGDGVPQDDRTANEWILKAALQGHGLAQFHVTSVNRGLAKRGNADGQYQLGMMYANGICVSQDDRSAVEWYQKAANQEHPEAQHELGVMYANGRGVPKDETKAAEWFQKAMGQHKKTAEEQEQRREKEARRRLAEEQTKKERERSQSKETHQYTVSDEIKICFDTLELEYFASFDEVKEKRMFMIKFYHPDQHSSNATTRKYADNKTKEINNAFDILRTKHFLR